MNPTKPSRKTKNQRKTTDYEAVVDGTITDAKEQLGEMEDVDYDELLEAEKEGKDRKTFKQWIESQTE
jgi:hypothetical protein